MESSTTYSAGTFRVLSLCVLACSLCFAATSSAQDAISARAVPQRLGADDRESSTFSYESERNGSDARSERVATLKREDRFISSAYAPSPSLDERDQDASNSLDLDDVNAFEEEPNKGRANPALEANALQDGEDDADGEDVGVDGSFDELYDLTLASLGRYLDLFETHPVTAEWTSEVVDAIDLILRRLEDDPKNLKPLVDRFLALVGQAEHYKKKLESEDRAARSERQRWNDDSAPLLSSRYSLTQRLELLDDFRQALELRAKIWSRAGEYFAIERVGGLKTPQRLSARRVANLLKETERVRAFFGDAPNGVSWRKSFDVDALAQEASKFLETATGRFEPTPRDGLNRTIVSEPYASSADLNAPNARSTGSDLLAQRERDRRERFLRDRINTAAYKIEKTPMTPEQRRVFQREELANWEAMLSELTCDQTDGLELLCDFERYESLRGGQTGGKLQQAALRASTSASLESRRFGQAIEAAYDNPNLKAYVSEALINRLLPIRDPEFGVVQERVLNNPVVGRRRVDTTVAIKLLPDPNRLLFSLDVRGKIVAQTSSEVMSTKLHNENYATYLGRKTLEWRDSGVAYSPAVVSADAVTRLDSVETEVDFVPIIGDMARGVARSQYEAKQYEIRQETREKVANEAKRRIDQEANARFDEVNQRLRTKFFANLSELGLTLRTQRSRTTDDWLLASLRLATDASLGAQSPEPPTLSGAFADVKIGESAVNAFLTQLELSGVRTDPKGALALIATKLKAPALADVEIEDSQLSFTFAQTDPIVVRFFEDKAQIVLAFDELTLGEKTWNDVEVAVSYRPSIDDKGAPTFTRDGNIELIGGPSGFRDQIPLRAIFTKVFPATRSFDLRPKLFQTDERFAGLKLGLCRVTNGWFAISVVKDDRYIVER